MIMFLFENMESAGARGRCSHEIWKNEILERLSWEDFHIAIPDFIKGYIVRINKIYGDVNNLKETIPKYINKKSYVWYIRAYR